MSIRVYSRGHQKNCCTPWNRQKERAKIQQLLNQFIPYSHFKRECLKSIKDVLKKDNFICKLDLQDAYFCIPLSEDAKRYVRFYWEGKLYQFLCLFGLLPALYIFTKFLKVPIVFVRQLSKGDTELQEYSDCLFLFIFYLFIIIYLFISH